MGYAVSLRCVDCYKRFPLDLLYACDACGGILDVEYDYAAIQKKGLIFRDLPGFWRYLDLLPIADEANIVSLGEGSTALIRSQRLARELGVSRLYIKNETTNPTGSFKDRPSCLGISLAKQLNEKAAVIASSGNAAVAVSAYAARAGIRALVFVPEHAPSNKLIQSAVYGAKVVRVKGPYSQSYLAAKAVSERYSLPNLTSTFINPFLIEADKTVAFEISESLGGLAPDYVLVPIGAGPLLVGCEKAFKELAILGIGQGVPRMIGVQAEGCAPIARAFEQGLDTVDSWVVPGRTVCSGIADQLQGYSQDGTHTSSSIRRTGGAAVDISDEDSLAAVRMLARTEGVFAEPSGAIGIAALKRLLAEGMIDPDSTVVCLVTGHGLKDPGAAVSITALDEPIDASRAGELDVSAMLGR